MITKERTGNTVARRQVGYFCHLNLDKKHLGAVMVTNQVGVPLEFKYTEPVTTTKLHKVLYGSALDRYLHETVIRERLSREVRTEPEYFLTSYEEKDFLGPIAGREMMAVQPFPVAQKESSGPFTRVRDNEAIVEMDDGSVLRLAFSTTDDVLQRGMVTWLQEISRTMDILEPMDRIINALKMLCGEEKQI
jgi:hypothetical protein